MLEVSPGKLKTILKISKSLELSDSNEATNGADKDEDIFEDDNPEPKGNDLD